MEREGETPQQAVLLALLAPSLVEAICAGRQSITLSTEKLTWHTHIRITWFEQKQLIETY